MKKLILIAIAALCCNFSALGQTSEDVLPPRDQMQTLLNSDIDHGVYLAPEAKITAFQDKTGLLVGGRLGWIINHRFSVGVGGYGLTTRNKLEPLPDENDVYLVTGYGGIVFEYTHNPNNLLHLSFPVLVGAGGIAYSRRYFEDPDTNPDPDSDDIIDSDAYLVVEPGVNLELNVVKFFRIGFGGSYRFASEVDMPATTNKDMSGFAGNITFKFGLF